MRLLLFVGALLMSAAAQAQSKSEWKLVIHGGAGVIERKSITPEKDRAVREGLGRALAAGELVLAGGGKALDAVEAAVRVLEDDPNFNAGRGAVFTWDGTHELDASIMDGSNRAAGSVAGVTTTKSPIRLARAVMEKSPHVMLEPRGCRRLRPRTGARAGAQQLFLDTRAARAARQAEGKQGERSGGRV